MLIGTGHKYCESNGEWYRHPETNRTWSNYTTCVNTEELQVTGSVEPAEIFGRNGTQNMTY